MNLLEKLPHIKDLATLPTVAFRLLEIMDDPDSSSQQVTSLVEADAPTTLKILRVANSPLYAVRREVSSVQQAVMNLGFTSVATIATSVALFSKLFTPTAQQNLSMQEFWRHSTATGTVARVLAKNLSMNLNEREFIGGLLHDIGKLAMIQYSPEQYEEVVKIVEEERLRDIEAEKRVFGATHNEAGRIIAKMWKLPADLTEIITEHSFVEQAETESLLVVRIADLLCEIWGAGVHEGVWELELEKEKAWSRLCEIRPSLQEMDLEVFTFELEEEFKRADMFIQMMIGD